MVKPAFRVRRRTFVCAAILSLVATGFFLTESCRQDRTSGEPVDKAGFVFKDKLSEYGFFAGNLKALHPSMPLFHYELATPLFSDYATKDRFIFIPKGRSAAYAGDGLPDFPDSTIILKNFSYHDSLRRQIMIETRMLVRDPLDHQWKVMDYLWNSEQTEAFRHITGAKVPLTLLDDDGNRISTVYQVPNTNDCKRCHISNGVLTPLGPKIRNLNFAVAGQAQNQLTIWAAMGGIRGLDSLQRMARLPNWKDEMNFSLDQRARAYLDVNCAHCHNPGGDAANSGLFLEYEQADRGHLGFAKSPVSAGGGAGGLDYDIVPGDAAHSILAYRMGSTQAGTAMPELGRSIVHKEGLALISQWINGMLPAKKKG